MSLRTYRCHLLLFATLSCLGISTAQAVHCLELYDTTEQPLFVVTVAEMLAPDVVRMTKGLKPVLEAPTPVEGVSGVRYFRAASDDKFHVYAIEGVPLREPDFPGVQIKGFSYAAPRPEAPKLGTPDFAKEFLALQNRFMRSNDQTLVATVGSKEVSIRLGPSETVVGALRLPVPNKPHALVVTHQREAPIGFGKRPGTYSVNLYVITDTGYQWTRFRVSGEDVTPKIDLVNGDDYGFVLNVDNRPFQLVFTAPGKRASETPLHLDDLRKSSEKNAEKKRVEPPAEQPQASADLLFPMRK
jgi:hypothetical protein